LTPAYVRFEKSSFKDSTFYKVPNNVYALNGFLPTIYNLPKISYNIIPALQTSHFSSYSLLITSGAI
jgi:hypothetical protein